MTKIEIAIEYLEPITKHPTMTGEYCEHLITAIAALKERAEQEGRCVVLPCKVGDTLYAIADCADIIKLYDDDYFTGTGAIECPFEKDCTFEECDDGNRRVFETVCNGFLIDKDGNLIVFLDFINAAFGPFDFGKTVFLTRAEAEAALAKGAEHD